jgi:hypothetical protein
LCCSSSDLVEKRRSQYGHCKTSVISLPLGACPREGWHRNVPPRALALRNSVTHAHGLPLSNLQIPRLSEDDDNPKLAFDGQSCRVRGAGFEETLWAFKSIESFSDFLEGEKKRGPGGPSNPAWVSGCARARDEAHRRVDESEKSDLTLWPVTGQPSETARSRRFPISGPRSRRTRTRARPASAVW